MYIKFFNEIYSQDELFFQIFDAKPIEKFEINMLLDTVNKHDILLSSDMHFLTDSEDIDNEMILAHNNLIKEKSNKIWINLGDIGYKYNLDRKRLSDKICALNKPKYSILIRGNHDLFEDSFYKACGFNLILKQPLKYHNIIFSHIPVKNKYLFNNSVNIHGHLHEYSVKFLYNSASGKYPAQEYKYNDRYVVYTRQPPYSPINLSQALSYIDYDE